MRGFGAVLVGRARAQRVWGLEVLLGLGLLQVHQELESWFGNRIRHIVSDIDLQQEEGKAKRIREVYWNSSVSKHLQMSHKEQHRHKICSEGGNGRHRGNRGFTTQFCLYISCTRAGTITFSSIN